MPNGALHSEGKRNVGFEWRERWIPTRRFDCPARSRKHNAPNAPRDKRRKRASNSRLIRIDFIHCVLLQSTEWRPRSNGEKSQRFAFIGVEKRFLRGRTGTAKACNVDAKALASIPPKMHITDSSYTGTYPHSGYLAISAEQPCFRLIINRSYCHRPCEKRRFYYVRERDVRNFAKIDRVNE